MGDDYSILGNSPLELQVVNGIGIGLASDNSSIWGDGDSTANQATLNFPWNPWQDMADKVKAATQTSSDWKDILSVDDANCIVSNRNGCITEKSLADMIREELHEVLIKDGITPDPDSIPSRKYKLKHK